MAEYKVEALRIFLRTILGDAYRWKVSDIHARLAGSDGNSCWVWPGYCDNKGYGTINVGSYFFKTHRLSFEAFKGKIPDSFKVMHTCDNPPCWNPNHLFLGTHAENMQDMVYKGRHRKRLIQTVISRITRKR